MKWSCDYKNSFRVSNKRDTLLHYSYAFYAFLLFSKRSKYKSSSSLLTLNEDILGYKSKERNEIKHRIQKLWPSPPHPPVLAVYKLLQRIKYKMSFLNRPKLGYPKLLNIWQTLNGQRYLLWVRLFYGNTFSL